MVKYDFVVVGGGTAGCAAAYTAGKLGFKTLLVEKNAHLGGSITSGLVVPAMKAGKNQINTDFFNILCEELHKIGGQITYQDNKGWFNPELTKIVLDKLMKDVGVEVVFGAKVKSVNIENHIIKSLGILSPYNDSIQNVKEILSAPIETRYVIDATGNCEVGKICNCNFLQKETETQPLSLRFMMGNVDLKRFSD